MIFACRKAEPDGAPSRELHGSNGRRVQTDPKAQIERNGIDPDSVPGKLELGVMPPEERDPGCTLAVLPADTYAVSSR